MNLPVVARILEGLSKEGLVRPAGGNDGRQSEKFEFHTDGSLVIGVDIGGTKMFAALANIGGEILRKAAVESHGAQGEQAFDVLMELIRQLLEAPEVQSRPVFALAAGAPGFVYHQPGIVRWAPALNWRDYPLKEKLQQHLSMPVFIDNDVNLAVLGEYWFGTNKGVRDLVLITLGTGVGAGLILNGALHRGGHEAAGEIGFMLPGKEALGLHYDSFGALESIISGSGIAERARQTLIGVIPDQEIQSVTAKEVFAAARHKAPWAVQVVNETIDLLALTIANISALIDPEVVLLGGGVAASADLLLEPLRQRLDGIGPFSPARRCLWFGQACMYNGSNCPKHLHDHWSF